MTCPTTIIIEKMTHDKWNELMAKRREEVRRNLIQYQFEVIKSGMAPLPIPLDPVLEEMLDEANIPIPEYQEKKEANKQSTSLEDGFTSKTNTLPRRFGGGFRSKTPEK